MNHADTDEEIYAALGRTLAGQNPTTSLDQVLARGRRTRIRHRAAAGVAAGVTAALAAIGALAPSGGQGPATAGPSAHRIQGLDIENAGFSLKGNRDGTVTLQVSTLVDPQALQGALARAGVNAYVQVVYVNDGPFGYRCRPWPGISRLDVRGLFRGTHQAATQITMMPSAIPSDAVLSFAFITRTGTRISAVDMGVYSGTPGPCIPVAAQPHATIPAP